MTERSLTTPAEVRRPGRRRTALTLVVLAPVVAEVTLGTVRLAMIWVVLIYLPIYGTGVLVVREVVRRTGGGWGSVLLLGLAYGLVEEGVALQSLTSPHLYGAAGWAPRPFGINSAYAELNLPYHAVFSVAIPIALVERMFPALRRTPFLRRGGLIVTAIVAVLGVGLLRASVPPSEDPGYTLPAPALAVLCLLIVALVLAAVRFPAGSRPSGAEPPRPAVVGSGCAAAVLAYLGLLYPFGGARRPAFTEGCGSWSRCWRPPWWAFRPAWPSGDGAPPRAGRPGTSSPPSGERSWRTPRSARSPSPPRTVRRTWPSCSPGVEPPCFCSRY
jgi:hypothetical protein